MPPRDLAPHLAALCCRVLLWGLACVASAIAGPAPAAYKVIDDALWDNPHRVLREARSSLRAQPDANPDKILEAALRLSLAGETLELADAAREGVNEGMPLAQLRQDDAAICIFRGTQAYLASQHGGKLDPVIQAYADAVAFARQAGLDWCVARLQLQWGRMYSLAGRDADALEVIVQAYRLFEASNDRARTASALADLCWIYHREADNPLSLQRAIESGEAALAMLQPERQRYLAATVHHNLGGAYAAKQAWPQARDHVARALSYATAIDDVVGTAYIGRLLGDIDMATGRFQQALSHYDTAAAVFARYDNADMLMEVRLSRVDALMSLRRPREALREIEATEPLRAQVDSAMADVKYHRAALGVFEAGGDIVNALRESKALTEAQQRYFHEANRKAANEWQERFEAPRKEAENRLLREKQRTAEAQRWLLLVILLLAVALLGGMAAYLYQQQRVKRRFAALATQDDLTGMPNRRSILDIAQQVQSDRRRGHEPACVAILDIDHFKQVNDSHGHDVGDAALVSFAQVCASQLRDGDSLGRYGGEEFMLVMPGTRLADLPAVFARLQEGLRARQVAGMAPQARLTFSMGGTLLQTDEPLVQAIQRADEALYRAKREGRDQLAVSQTPVDRAQGGAPRSAATAGCG